MCQATLCILAALFLPFPSMTAAAQMPAATPATAAASKAPDIVCFGHNPEWSIQFLSWGARYLGIKQPDQNFVGKFNWDPNRQVWAWLPQTGPQTGAPEPGNYQLSATMRKQSCTDPKQNQKYPYSAEVNLPQGSMVSGCCRKLKPGEAPVGPNGAPPQVHPPK